MIFPLSREWLLRRYAPGYLNQMPVDQPGEWIAEAFTVSVFGYKWIRVSVPVSGLRNAYVRARWEALKLDLFGDVSELCSIKWGVRQSEVSTS